MPELEVLEAKVPVRTPRLIEVETEPKSGRFAPVAGWLSGPVFSRARDIFAANMTELLDRAEDPARMIRMIILEMEETLVEVRATAARSIADIKEMRRAVSRLDELQAELDRQGRARAVARAVTTSPRRRWSKSRSRRDGRWPARRARADGAGASRLRGRHRQASGQAPRSARPAERDRGAVRERGDPGQGPRDHARQPDARRVREVRAARAPRRLRRRPLRCAGDHQPRRRNRPAAGVRKDRRRAGSHESRAAKRARTEGRKGK